MSCGIYKITNQVNGHCYIGQSVQIEQRWKNHLYTAKKEVNNHAPIYSALRKYGMDNFQFQILEECEQCDLDERERYWINYYDSYNNGYNATQGGQDHPYQLDINITRNKWDEGLSVGKIAQELNINPHTVRSHLIGYSDYSIDKSRQRGAANNNHIDNLPTISKTVYQYSLDGTFLAIYGSIAEAERTLGLQEHSGIYAVVNGRQHSAYGYQWSYEKKEKLAALTPQNMPIRCINTGEIFESLRQAQAWAELKVKPELTIVVKENRKLQAYTQLLMKNCNGNMLNKGNLCNEIILIQCFDY